MPTQTYRRRVERPVMAARWWPPGDWRHEQFPLGRVRRDGFRAGWCIETAEGALFVRPGDYVIVHSDRTMSVLPEHRFEELYELVSEEEATDEAPQG